MAAELDAMMIGMSDKVVHDWSLNSLRTIARSAREQVRQVPAISHTASERRPQQQGLQIH